MIPTGVLYQLSGERCAPLLVVSLHTLRKVYDGPVTVALTEDCMKHGSYCARHFGVDTLQIELLHNASRPHLCTKTETWLQTPYQRTVYLDCDTCIIEPIDPLFRIKAPVAVPRMMGSGIADRGRIPKFYRDKMKPLYAYGRRLSAMADASVEANVPVLNTGVLSYDRDAYFLDIVHAVTLVAKRNRVDDECVFQAVAGAHPLSVQVLPQTWNHSFKYGGTAQRAKILHFHRKAWCGEGREAYLPFWRAACKQLDLATWATDCFGHFGLLSE